MTTEVETPTTTEELTPPQEAPVETQLAEAVSEAEPESISEVDEPDEELESYLKEEGLIDPEDEGKDADTKAYPAYIDKLTGEDRTQAIADWNAQAEESARRVAEAKEKAKLDKHNAEEGRKRTFNIRRGRLRNSLAQAGANEALLKQVDDEFVGYHADSQAIAEQSVTSIVTGALYDLMRGELRESQRSEFEKALRLEPEAFIKRYGELKTEGLYTERQLKESKVEALRKHQAKLHKQGVLPGDKGPDLNTAGSSSGGKSDAELLADPHTPVEKIMEIRARQRAAGG